MKLVLIQEQGGFGRLFCDNRYLCFTRERGQVLEAGEYTLRLAFNQRLNRELPKVPGDNEMWLYPAPRSGVPPEGIELGERRNSRGVTNGSRAVDKILDAIEEYLLGADEVLLVVS